MIEFLSEYAKGPKTAWDRQKVRDTLLRLIFEYMDSDIAFVQDYSAKITKVISSLKYQRLVKLESQRNEFRREKKELEDLENGYGNAIGRYLTDVYEGTAKPSQRLMEILKEKEESMYLNHIGNGLTAVQLGKVLEPEKYKHSFPFYQHEPGHDSLIGIVKHDDLIDSLKKSSKTVPISVGGTTERQEVPICEVILQLLLLGLDKDRVDSMKDSWKNNS